MKYPAFALQVRPKELVNQLRSVAHCRGWPVIYVQDAISLRRLLLRAFVVLAVELDSLASPALDLIRLGSTFRHRCLTLAIVPEGCAELAAACRDLGARWVVCSRQAAFEVETLAETVGQGLVNLIGASTE